MYLTAIYLAVTLGFGGWRTLAVFEAVGRFFHRQSAYGTGRLIKTTFPPNWERRKTVFGSIPLSASSLFLVSAQRPQAFASQRAPA